MKKSELTFMEGFTTGLGNNKNPFKTFDWDKAAQIIKAELAIHPNLTAEAGLQRDWDCTGGEIFENGKPVTESYTYLQSNWAIPTLIISVDGEEIKELPCFTEDENTRFNEGSKWDEISLNILNSK